MEIPVTPDVKIEGDRKDRLMARMGVCVALTKTRAVYRYGFRPKSAAAEAYGVSVKAFIWVLWDLDNGKELARFEGAAKDLPQRFKTIFEKPYEYTNGSSKKAGRK